MDNKKYLKWMYRKMADVWKKWEKWENGYRRINRESWHDDIIDKLWDNFDYDMPMWVLNVVNKFDTYICDVLIGYFDINLTKSDYTVWINDYMCKIGKNYMYK